MTEEKKHTKKDQAIGITVCAVFIACMGILCVVVFLYGPSFGAYLDSTLEGDVETITIGDSSGTLITRTQIKDCPYNSIFACIDKEIYTGIIIEANQDKIVFEDGCVLMADYIGNFYYKIGAEHTIEVEFVTSEFGGGWKVVRMVTILN